MNETRGAASNWLRGTSPSSARPSPLWFGALVLLGLLGHHLKLPLFYGVEFVFGSIAPFIVLGLYGTRLAVLCAAIVNLYTLRLWGHPWMFFIMTAEILATGLLIRRVRGSFIVATGLFWLVIGTPYVWGVFSQILGVDPNAAWTAAMKSTLNEVICALVASLLLTFTPLRQRSLIPKEQLTSLFPTLFNLSAAVALFPACIVMILHARSIVKKSENDMRFNLSSTATATETNLEHWNELHIRTVEELAHLALKLGLDIRSGELQRATEMMTLATPEFLTMYVADENGKTITHYPTTTTTGESTVGLDFSDRPYFKATKELRTTQISAVFRARGAITEPVVSVSAPILRDGQFIGIALATLDLHKMSDLIRRNGYTMSVLDNEGQLVTSTRSDLKPLDKNWEQKPDFVIEPDGQGFFRRAPTLPGPPMARWAATYYGFEGSIRTLPGWKLIIEAPFAPYQAALHEQYSRSMALLLGLCIVALALSYFFAYRLASPLAALARQTSELSNKVTAQVQVRWPKSEIMEVNDLVANFKKMNAELVRKFQDQEAINENLLQTNRMKDEFLATLSHELRTPLNVLNGYIQLMQEEGWTAEAADYLAIMARNSDNLNAIIQDLLDASRAITGKLVLEKSVVDLSVIAVHATESIRLGAEAKSIQVVTRSPSTSPLVHGDPARLQQVLWNLLSNSIKFTPTGGLIEISFGINDRDIALRVRDTGEGIDRNFLPHVFDRFRQENQSYTRIHGGLGLGLSIVRQLVEMHGGTIRAESEGKGKGAVFTVTLPRVSNEPRAHS